MFKKVSIALMWTAVVLPMSAWAEEEHEHYDVRPKIVENKIIVGGHSHNLAELPDHPAPKSVFVYEIGPTDEDPLLPANGSLSPGFGYRKADTADTGGWINGSTISFKFVSPLYYWNGVGLPTEPFTAATSGQKIRFSLTSEASVLSGTSGVSTGFNIDTAGDVDGPGGTEIFHKHITVDLYNRVDFILFPVPTIEYIADPASAPHTDGTYVPEGVYFFQLKVETTQAGVASSDPFWIVYGYGETGHAAAHELEEFFSGESEIPEPASLSVLALGAAGLLLRRRKA